MSSAEVVCCKKLPKITDELSIEANSVDPDQTVPNWRLNMVKLTHRKLQCRPSRWKGCFSKTWGAYL